MSFELDEKKPISVGPWGGQNGHRWDDGVYTSVRQVVIAHGTGIDSIQIEYDKKGSSVWSEKHGGGGGNKVDKVKLDFPNEFLTSVHGYYGSTNEWGSVFVRSLTFESNKKRYGPFGTEGGTYFTFQMTGGKIVGFHGKSGWYLDAIGVYLKTLHNSDTRKTLVRTQNIVDNGSEKHDFSVIQESVSKGYDIVIAVRQKDDGSNPLAFQRKLARQNSFSKEFSDMGFQERLISAPKVQPPMELPLKLLTPMVTGSLTFGPWGGNGGTPFDDGIHKGIRQITLSRNVGIVSMRVMYDKDGEAILGNKNGGTGGFKTDKIVLDYPSEILTHITGTMGPLMKMGPTVIKSLTFYTNKAKYGPFGEEQGPSFTSKLNEGKIVGFHGRGGLFLDALGVHVMEGKIPPMMPPHSTAILPRETNHVSAPHSTAIVTRETKHVSAPHSTAIVPRETKHVSAPHSTAIVPRETKHVSAPHSLMDSTQWSNYKLVVANQGLIDQEVSCGVMKEPAPCEAGPWGGDGGKAWDDGVFSGIRQIFVSRGEAICSIQIEFDRNGQSVWSAKHGGDGGSTTHRIKLEYPNEVLVCISGYYGSITKDVRPNVIKSLTFYTSRGKYGPYGEETGSYFTSTTTQGKVVGFHGRGSMYLDAIGVHTQHWLGNQKPAKSSLFRKVK